MREQIPWKNYDNLNKNNSRAVELRFCNAIASLPQVLDYILTKLGLSRLGVATYRGGDLDIADPACSLLNQLMSRDDFCGEIAAHLTLIKRWVSEEA